MAKVKFDRQQDKDKITLPARPPKDVECLCLVTLYLQGVLASAFIPRYVRFDVLYSLKLKNTSQALAENYF